MVSINLPLRRVYQFSSLLVALLLFFVVGTGWAHLQPLPAPTHLLAFLQVHLNLAGENAIAVWFASMLLLLAGLAAFLCFAADAAFYKTGSRSLLNFGWLFIAAVCVLLSFDEMGSLHEHIGDTALLKKAGKGNGWAFFGNIVVWVGAGMLWFSWARLRTVPTALVFFVLGTLLYLTNSYQEAYEIDTFRQAADPLHWRRPVHLLLLEEGSELAGSACFLFACITYLRRRAATGKTLHLVLPCSFALFRLALAAALFAGGIAMALLYKFAPPRSGSDGIPANWPPAVTSMLVMLYGAYQWQHRRQHGGQFMPLLLSLFALTRSALAGANLMRFELLATPVPPLALALFWVWGIVPVWWLAIQSRTPAANWLLGAWVVVLLLALGCTGVYHIFLLYAANAALLLGLAFLHGPVPVWANKAAPGLAQSIGS